MGDIANFYNLSPRLFIFATHIPPILTTRTVRLPHPVTKIRLPPGTLHVSSAKPRSHCEARAYSVIC